MASQAEYELLSYDDHEDGIVEFGFWCAFEGMYFTDEREIKEGHYGYKCGDGDEDGEWFIPHDVYPVAVVQVGARL